MSAGARRDRHGCATHRRSAGLIGLLIALTALAGCGEASEIAGQDFTPLTAGTLTVATSLPAPGFWDGDDAATLTGGFEYELAQLMAERWGLDLEIVDVPFDDLVAGDLHGADMALSQITVTDQRETRLTFSIPYYVDDDGAVVPAGDEITDLHTAREQRWGAIVDSTQLELLHDVVEPDAPVETFADTRSAVTAVADGRIDAALLDLTTALIVSDGSDSITTGGRILVEDPMAVALPPDSPNGEVVDAALRAFTSDGSIDDLIERYLFPIFESEPDAIPIIRTRQ